jgi:hypothetical protein
MHDFWKNKRNLIFFYNFKKVQFFDINVYFSHFN